MHKTVTNMTSTLGTSLQRVCSLGTATNGRNFSSERIVDFMMLYVQARPVGRWTRDSISAPAIGEYRVPFSRRFRGRFRGRFRIRFRS